MNIAAKIWGAFAANHNSRPGATDMASISKIEPARQVLAGTVHWFNECVTRSQMGVFSEVSTVTPGLAAELLRRNAGNRSIRQVKASQYATDMRAGRWAFNGEPLIISDTGELNDGQHRLQAVVDANISLPFLFVFGLPRESRETVDQGAARGASDYLSMGGMENATTMGTIARIALAYELSDGQNVETREITNSQVVNRCRSDLRMAASAHYAVSMGRKAANYAAGGIIGFCHYQFSAIDADDAVAFLNQVCTGVGLKAGSPAIAVRERLLAEGKSRNRKIAVIFRGWNFFRRGMNVRATSLPGTLPLPALI